MSDATPDLDLDALEAHIANLPHRPWQVWKEGPTDRDGEIVSAEPLESRRNPADEEFWSLEEDGGNHGKLLRGIVAAVNATPGLIARVRKLEAFLARAQTVARDSTCPGDTRDDVTPVGCETVDALESALSWLEEER